MFSEPEESALGTLARLMSAFRLVDLLEQVVDAETPSTTWVSTVFAQLADLGVDAVGLTQEILVVEIAWVRSKADEGSFAARRSWRRSRPAG